MDTLCILHPSTLTTAQQNYVAIEIEDIAVLWAVQKFYHYLYGTSFMLQMDQKHLQAILSKSLVEAVKYSIHMFAHRTMLYSLLPNCLIMS